MLTIPKYHIAHIPHSQSVHQDGTYRHLSCHLGTVIVHLQHFAGREDKDMILVHAKALGYFGLGFQMLVFTMDWHRIFGMDQSVEQLNLFLAGMS